ncbi:MAG: pilus assembly protein PilM [Chitinispirillales bacterium]|jgi:Tfp pilus assembly PilM family ATPase|nr:pilus assembly protein PilM [Chitinispirillales bacterium]
MAKQSALTTAIDIQRGYLSVIRFDRGMLSMQQAAVQPLPACAPGAYWNAVAGELKSIGKKIKFAGSGVICSVPCDMAVVKTLEADSGERDQDEILRWELGAGLAGAVGEYAFDFYEVDPGDQVDRRRYAAAAMRADTVGKLKKAFKSVKLNPHVIDIDLFALTNVFQMNYRDRLSGASILVHGEPNCTKAVLIRDSSYVDCGVFGFDFFERGATDYIAALNSEASRLAAGCGVAQGGAGVYLAGSLFTDGRFAASVASGVQGCEVLDPFKSVHCDDERIKTHAPQLAVAVGLALRGDEAV